MNAGAAAANLDSLVTRVLARWPEHAGYVAKSFEGRDDGVTAVGDDVARIILALGPHIDGGVDGVIDDYRFLCESIMLPEELHFRRHGTYRLSSFADAERECYANPEFMNRYMNGVLLSSIMWSNHAHAFATYVNDYLPRLPADAAHLEIGPGHGLFLYFAARRLSGGRVEGWDVSPTSIAHTRAALTTLGVGPSVELKLGNLFDSAEKESSAGFDSIVMSEILEHLEDPVAALRAASRHLKPGGLIWVNVPANSPAPDHIFLVKGPEHAVTLLRDAGLEIVDSAAFPMSGTTLEKAIKRKLTVTCIVLARKPGGDGAMG